MIERALGGLRWRSLGFDAAALILAAASWFVFSQVDAFENVSGELLQNTSFQAGLSGWRVSGGVVRLKSGAVDLSAHAPSRSHVISQTLPRPQSGYLRVTADALISGVTRGPQSWQSARVDVLGLDKSGHAHWDFPHKLAAVTGSRHLRDVSRVFYIPERYHRVQIEAELTGGTGTFLVRHLSAREAQPRMVIIGVKDAILIGWILFIPLVVIILIRVHAWHLMIALLPGGALLLFIPRGFLHFVAHLLTFNGLNLALDHLALFIVMTWLALRGSSRHQLESIVHLAVMGVVVEAIQYYLPGRFSEFMDIMSDWLGIGLALLAYEVIFRLRLGSSGPLLTNVSNHSKN